MKPNPTRSLFLTRISEFYSSLSGMIRYTDTETDAGSEFIGEGEWESSKEMPGVQSKSLQDV